MEKIAFLILAHSDPQHLKELVNALGVDNDIYIHIDKKSNIQNFTNLIKDNNVTFIQNRFKVSWGGISIVDAQIELIRAAINSKNNYLHLLSISGSDYPLKPISELREFLSSRREKEFIKFIDMRESTDHYMNHLNYNNYKEPLFYSTNSILIILDKVIRKGLRSLKFKNEWKKEVIPYFGSSWWALTPACCKYILQYHLENPWFYEMNKRTFAPDEHFFHTIVGNSQFLEASGGVQEFRFVGTWQFANLHLIDPSLAKWFTLDDWEQVTNSNQFFVRKIRSSDGASLVKRIKEKFLSKGSVRKNKPSTNIDTAQE
ncbi:beta-1,6-N-acetylglucosaminyltransferase [Pleomorphovibrio marinus]|uniref:beta-1,6-N-acetylglucosaminyltransferase n=1 Tax=Pleomorphovibrio marinus TaxID=2164132 RepID=UPI000E0BB071|nr:beta-1,6-N-acetylglucosaminyltransferase [Pleomorphovibrio marinus]